MSENKNQHYLSAFYIYQFTNDKQRSENGGNNRKTKVNHFDFSKNKLKERPIENIATKPYLLSYKDIDGVYDHSLDERLRKVEGNASGAFKELNDLYRIISRSKPSKVEIPNEIINSIVELLVWQIAVHPDLIGGFESECSAYLSESKFYDLSSEKMALDVVRNIIDGELNIRDELLKKNKTIICTSSEYSHFITSDKPFVTFNKSSANGIGVEGAEMYYPLTSNMLLYMHGDGDKKKIIFENDDMILEQLNSYIAKNAKKYLIGKSDVYLKRIHKNITASKGESL
jgi:hypothetical protein